MKKILSVWTSTFLQYLPYLQEALGPNYCIFTKWYEEIEWDTNGRDTLTAIQYLEYKKNQWFTCDAIIVQLGGHDIKIDRQTNKQTTTLEQFEQNLHKIITISNEISDKIIRITPPFFNEKIHNQHNQYAIRKEWDMEKYNNKATQIMSEIQIPVIDLRNSTKTMYNKNTENVWTNHSHYRAQYQEKQGHHVAKEILRNKYL